MIAVGNLTAGGTGKTPLVAYIASYLLRKGKKVAIVSRGYGRRSKGVQVVADATGLLLDVEQGGDEPVQLAAALPGVTVIVGERRLEAAQRAVHEYGVDVVVLDDAFQHRAIHRDLNIVVADARRPLPAEPMLPAGLRREPLQALERADVLVFSHVDARNPGVSWERELQRWFAGERLFGVRSHDGILDVRSGRMLPPDALNGRACCVVSGIGDHRQFVEGVGALHAEIRAELRFRDHHWFTAGEIRTIGSTADAAGADAIVTTAKDLVRMKWLTEEYVALMKRMDILVPNLAIQLHPAGRLEALIDNALRVTG